MTPDDINIALARELNSLSLPERNRAVESLHGVDEVVKETPQFLAAKLREFQSALDLLLLQGWEQRNITFTNHYAYEKARQQSETYVRSREFRLMFLRAESFDAKQAARRMLIYLEEKLSRFGPESLTRPLTMMDLSPQCRALLVDLGIHQILPTRDSAGRAVYLIHEDESPRDMIREDPMATDEETQKRGIVSLQVISVLPKLEEMEVIRINFKRGNSCDWSPVRIKANHIWVKTLSNNPLIRLILDTWSKGNLTRLRIHTGSYTELRYQLLTFGFPSECLPYSIDGENLRMNTHQRWLSRRRKKESMLQNNRDFKAVDLPGCRDVCLGRGSASHQHSGNVIMRALMSSLVDEYRVANSRVRKVLNKQLIQMVRAGGGRFLKKKGDGWYEEVPDDDEIEQKVGGSFRGMISRASVELSYEYDGLHDEYKAVNIAPKRPRLDIPQTSNNCFCGYLGRMSPSLRQEALSETRNI